MKVERLVTKNKEQEIESSNYWSSEYARHGIVYFSVNAGAVRVLLPERVDPELLKALKKAQYAIVSRDNAGTGYEVLLEDMSSYPYVILSPVQAWDRLLPCSESGREHIPLLVYVKGPRLIESLECKFRCVPRLPWGKPWQCAAAKAPTDDAQRTIATCLGGLNDSSKAYPTELPPELKRWYCYPIDAGHSILCILKADWDGRTVNWKSLDHCVPVPVKTVLRGYSIHDGLVIVDVPYDMEVGLLSPEEDDEY